MLLAPAAAAIGGAVRRVEIRELDGGVSAWITSEGGVINDSAISELRSRLEAISREARLHLTRRGDLTTVELRVPVHRETTRPRLQSRVSGERWDAIARG
jgi:hypothetical protein